MDNVETKNQQSAINVKAHLLLRGNRNASNAMSLQVLVPKPKVGATGIRARWNLLSSASVQNVEIWETPADSAAVLPVVLGTVCVALSRKASSTRGQKVSTRAKEQTEGC